MDIKDIEPNSFKYKDAKREMADKKIEKVISGAAKTKKKSEMRKFAGLFIPDDVQSVKSYIFFDVLIPAIKQMLSETVDAVLYPGEGNRKRKSGSKVSYRSYYEDPRKRSDYISSRTDGFDYDDIIFESRGDAERVLATMDEILERYGVVTVSDLYDLADITTPNYMTAKYGWVNIRSATVMRVREGFVIKMPKAAPIQ